jgi:ribosomal-protein-alanine N-acetyltransferase
MLRPRGPIDSLTLRTPRLEIRPIEPTDKDAYVAFALENDAFFARYSPPPPGRASAEQAFDLHLSRSQEGLTTGTALRCLAWQNDGTELIGMIGLSDIVRGVSQRCNVGYRVGERFTRKGLGLEMLRALLTHAFAEDGLALHRVECAIQPTNAPSLRLAQKAGFRQEGYAPRFLFIANDWKDHVLFAITAEEFVTSPEKSQC